MFMLYTTGQRVSTCPFIKPTIQHCSEYMNQCFYPFLENEMKKKNSKMGYFCSNAAGKVTSN